MIGPRAANTVLREARLGLQLSLAEVAGQMARLEEQQPMAYSSLDRTNINYLETGRTDWRTSGARGLRALLTVLFGSLEAFAQVAGTDAYLSPATNRPRASDSELALALSLRQQADMDMQLLARRTAELAEAEPEAYRAVSKSAVHRLLTGDVPLSGRPATATRAVIAALFGSVETFVHETGLDPFLSAAGLSPLAPVPLWPVGVTLDPADLVLAPQAWITPQQPARYALEVQGDELRGLVPAGGMLWVRPTERAQRGDLHVIYRHGQISVAWALSDDTFGELSGRYFQLRERDTVLGVVLNEGVQAPLEALPLSQAG